MKNEEFRKNLRNLMDEKGCTQDDVAKAIDVSPSTVSHWYIGLSCPRGETLLHLANYLCVSPSMLMGEKRTLALMDEEKLLHDFRMLSPTGKEKALERIHELTQLYWYNNIAKE